MMIQEHSFPFGSPIAGGLMLAYTFILGSTFTLEVDAKMIVTIAGIALANLIAMLKWGLKVEKAITKYDTQIEGLMEQLKDLVKKLEDK